MPTGVHRRSATAGLMRGNVAPSPSQPTQSLSGTLTELWGMRQADRNDRRIGFLPWSMKVPEPKTGTLDFGRFPFQRELYDAGASDKEAVIEKASQVGISTFALRWAMYWADQRGWTGLYLFPKRQQMYDFSDARVKPVIERSEYLSSRVPAGYTQNKGLKQIGLGLVYFRGSESRDDLLSIDADHLVMDEYNDLKVANVPDAEKRIGASPHGLIRRLGVPTIPDYGISDLYNRSDQRLWTVACPRCGEWQSPDFWKNVVGDEHHAELRCREEDCRAPLDVTTGEWVAAYPDRPVRGYRVSRLLMQGADLASMVKRSKDRRPLDVQNFHNHDLGLPYAPEEGRLTETALLAAQSAGGGYTTAQHPGYAGGDLVTMGVDVASVRDLNVRISLHLNEREKIALFLGTVESFNDLPDLMRRYSVRMCAIDAAPEFRTAMSFAEAFPGRVYLLRQATGDTQQVITVKEDERIVVVRRVEMLDATLEMIRGQRNRLPMDWPEDYVFQMKAVQRVVTKDDLGVPKVGYVVTGPTDADWAFAEAHDIVATELYWYRQEIDESQREVFSRLEDKLEFERADLSDLESDAGGYYEGPSEGDYFGDDY